MKIFSTDQIRDIDRFTIENEPVSSADLMERAANQLLGWYLRKFSRSQRIVIFTGPGNNGGDGLALARLLSGSGFKAEVFNVKISERTSDDWNHNMHRLKNETSVKFVTIENIDQFPFLGSDDIIIDAIFGSGLTREVSGLASEVINKINDTGCVIISVDIPSGLFGEDNSENSGMSIIKADHTLSFEFPKLSFLFAENEQYIGNLEILSIGLSPAAVRTTYSPYFITESTFISTLLRARRKFDHKGCFGHGLLVAGSYGRIGAAVLSAKAALKTGIGLLTCHVPCCGYQILQSCVPESMVKTDRNEILITDVDISGAYNALGIGPGLGKEPESQEAFHSFILDGGRPMVIDADGINILGINKKWLTDLPENTILTPHIREFERIAGSSENSYLRLKLQIELSERLKCVILLKGAYTSVTTPGGEVFFNNTGNPGMATAGSGDVLTGMILSLLAQGYSSVDAAVLGTYLHGLAGDIASTKTGYESLTASDIIDNIGSAFIKVYKDKIGF